MRFIHAVRDSDDAVVDDAVMRLSRARLWLAPLPPGVRALNAKTAALAAIEAPEVCLEWSSSQAFGYDTEAALGDPSGH